MPDYIAMFKMVGATQPTKTTFSADNVSNAIEKMLNSVNQKNTMQIEEFEILQDMGGGKVAIVASKNKRETRVIQSVNNSVVTNVSETAALITAIEEKTYTSYATVEA